MIFTNLYRFRISIHVTFTCQGHDHHEKRLFPQVLYRLTNVGLPREIFLACRIYRNIEEYYINDFWLEIYIEIKECIILYNKQQKIELTYKSVMMIRFWTREPASLCLPLLELLNYRVALRNFLGPQKRFVRELKKK